MRSEQVIAQLLGPVSDFCTQPCGFLFKTADKTVTRECAYLIGVQGQQHGLQQFATSNLAVEYLDDGHFRSARVAILHDGIALVIQAAQGFGLGPELNVNQYLKLQQRIGCCIVRPHFADELFKIVFDLEPLSDVFQKGGHGFEVGVNLAQYGFIGIAGMHQDPGLLVVQTA